MSDVIELSCGAPQAVTVCAGTPADCGVFVTETPAADPGLTTAVVVQAPAAAPVFRYETDPE